MKRILMILMLMPLMALATTLSDGLVAHYKFDGNAYDSSGNGNDGVVHGATLTTDRHGKINGAYKFGGCDAGGYIEVASSESLNSPTAEMTISAWVRPDAIEYPGGAYGRYSYDQWIATVVCKGAYSRQYCMQIEVNSGTRWLFSDYAGDILTTEPTLLLGIWQHVVLTDDGTSLKAYVNGVLVGSDVSEGDISTSNASLYIGKDCPGDIEYFNGAMDDVRIYNRALSASEVESLYNEGGDPIVSRTVTFDGIGGVVSAASRSVKNGAAVGELPTATRAGYDFVGWFTAAVGGTEVTATTVVDSDVTYFAQWRKVCVVIAGAANSVDVGLKGKGYATKALPRGLSYSDKTGMVTGICKTVTDEDGVMVTFAKKGAADVVVRFVVREEDAPSVGCALFESGEFTAGVLGAMGGIPLDLDAESGVRSLTMNGQPSGWKLVQDKTTKEWTIEGAATKAGTFNVTLTLTTAAGTKVEKKYAITVAPPHEMAVGTFNGFVTRRSIFDMDYAKTFGAIQVTATDAGKITAKITAAAKTYSFSASSWDAITASGYEVSMSLKSGETLSLVIDPSAGWSDHQLTGRFAYAVMPSDGTAYEVVAQRNAFGKQWYFLAEGDEAEGWTLSYVSSANEANLIVTLNADGKTSVAGTLVGRYTTLKVSASGYCDVSEHSIGNTIADFAPIVTVNRVKKVLSIRTNLWFDRKNSHDRIGSAELVD